MSNGKKEVGAGGRNTRTYVCMYVKSLTRDEAVHEVAEDDPVGPGPPEVPDHLPNQPVPGINVRVMMALTSTCAQRLRFLSLTHTVSTV